MHRYRHPSQLPKSRQAPVGSFSKFHGSWWRSHPACRVADGSSESTRLQVPEALGLFLQVGYSDLIQQPKSAHIKIFRSRPALPNSASLGFVSEVCTKPFEISSKSGSLRTGKR
jgi:hypothetical protein